MDIELARTFLAIVEAGSFVRAAERLNVTQTTVSARVRSLEDQLRRPVFLRNKAGVTLTAAGEQFLRFAPTLVQVWERARHQVAVPAGRRAILAMGGELTLWNPLLLNWMVWMRRSAPDIALQTQVGLSDGLLRQVADGVLDLAVVYSPRQWPGLQVELLMEETLVLVTTDPSTAGVSDPDYVYVDWGADFAAHHGLNFPQFSNPGLSIGLGPLGLDYIVQVGGTGYFRKRVAQSYLASGRLHLVPHAPEFPLPAYVVYPDDAGSDDLEAALAGLRAVAQAEEPQPRNGSTPAEPVTASQGADLGAPIPAE
ncbi:LysR family transcriptional regulator [Microvirga sp. VF16]|uniref:LysR family transcriptional regulator n=1 Tax=Microvirga sp. VF16 TaxID=2807101 RepID=UPI00193CB0A3|nr:LysR family transcriptional regulator [Microvirga sp. VF16]QRM35929.1 LysR family transcriptional regulator [Microvirga sp. VF16]